MPKLTKNSKHTIEVVVDRLSVRPDLKQRLAESFETALRNGDGRAIAVDMDYRRGAPVLGRSSPARSAATRCRSSSRACSRSTTRWAPARECDGLGSISFFDPRARGRRFRSFRSRRARSRAGTGATSSTSRCCRAWPSITTSISSGRSRLPERVQQMILYGSEQGEDRLPVHQRARQADGARARLRRHHPEPRAPLPRDRFDHGARGTREVPQFQAVPGMRRHAAAARSAQREGRRPRRSTK